MEKIEVGAIALAKVVDALCRNDGGLSLREMQATVRVNPDNPINTLRADLEAAIEANKTR